MFTSTAMADEPASTAGSATESILMNGPTLPMLMICVLFYFLLFRPQQKKLKDHETMIKALRRGDKVVTAGGVIGVISKIEADDVVIVEVAPDIKIRVLKDTISTVISKTVANDNKDDNMNSK